METGEGRRAESSVLLCCWCAAEMEKGGADLFDGVADLFSSSRTQKREGRRGAMGKEKRRRGMHPGGSVEKKQKGASSKIGRGGGRAARGGRGEEREEGGGRRGEVRGRMYRKRARCVGMWGCLLGEERQAVYKRGLRWVWCTRGRGAEMGQAKSLEERGDGRRWEEERDKTEGGTQEGARRKTTRWQGAGKRRRASKKAKASGSITRTEGRLLFLVLLCFCSLRRRLVAALSSSSSSSPLYPPLLCRRAK